MARFARSAPVATFRSAAQRVLRPSVPDRLVPRTVRPEACEAHALADSVERTSVTPPLRHRPQGRGAFLFLARGRPAREAALEKVGRGLRMPPYPLCPRAKGNGLGGSWGTRRLGRALEASGGTQQRQLPRCATAPKGRARQSRLRRSNAEHIDTCFPSFCPSFSVGFSVTLSVTISATISVGVSVASSVGFSVAFSVTISASTCALPTARTCTMRSRQSSASKSACRRRTCSTSPDARGVVGSGAQTITRPKADDGVRHLSQSGQRRAPCDPLRSRVRLRVLAPSPPQTGTPQAGTSFSLRR